MNNPKEIPNLRNKQLKVSEDFRDDINSLLKHTSFLELPESKQNNIKKILEICEARIVFNKILSDFYLTAPYDIVNKRIKKQYGTRYDACKTTEHRERYSAKALYDEKTYRDIISLLWSSISGSKKSAEKKFSQLFEELSDEAVLLREDRKDAQHMVDSVINKDLNETYSITEAYQKELELYSFEEILSQLAFLANADLVKKREFYNIYGGLSYLGKITNTKFTYGITFKSLEYRTYLEHEVRSVIQQIQGQLDLIPKSTYKSGKERDKDLDKLVKLKNTISAITNAINNLKISQNAHIKEDVYKIYDLYQTILSEYQKRADLIQHYTNEPKLAFAAQPTAVENSSATAATEQKESIENKFFVEPSTASSSSTSSASDSVSTLSSAATSTPSSILSSTPSSPPTPAPSSTTKTNQKSSSKTQPSRPLLFNFQNFASTHAGLGRGHMNTLEHLFDDAYLDEKIPLQELFNVIAASGGVKLTSGGSKTRYMMDSVVRDIEVTIPLHEHHRSRSDSRDRMADYITVMQFREYFKTVGTTKILGQYHKEKKAEYRAAVESINKSIRKP